MGAELEVRDAALEHQPTDESDVDSEQLGDGGDVDQDRERSAPGHQPGGD
jgi:hypothetical protein